MSSDLNLNYVGYQNRLRSKPIAENFTDIQNQFNLLRAEVYASISATASEVTTARGSYDSLDENINARAFNGYGIATGGEVTINGTGIDYSGGAGICHGGEGVEFNGYHFKPSYSTTTERVDMVVVNNDGSTSVIEGTETAPNPPIPNYTKTQLPVGIVGLSNNSISYVKNFSYGSPSVMEVFESTGVFFPPVYDGVKMVKVIIVGAGGDGGTSADYRGGGGGGSGEIKELYYKLTDDTPVDITFGGGRAYFGSLYATAGNNGAGTGAGGVGTFNGGNGGQGSPPGSGASGVAGTQRKQYGYSATAITNYETRIGYNGGSGGTTVGAIGGGGGGGAGFGGNGGNGATNGTPAQVGQGWGAGGGGGCNYIGGTAGGKGGHGVVIVEWIRG
jgi:hypothetical protein